MSLRDLLQAMPARATVHVNGRRIVRTPTGSWYIRRDGADCAFVVTDSVEDALTAAEPKCSQCLDTKPSGCGYCSDRTDGCGDQ